MDTSSRGSNSKSSQRLKILFAIVVATMVLTSVVLSAIALHYSYKRSSNEGNGDSINNVDHKLEPNTSYRLWNLATGSLLQRDPNNPENVISCNGNLNDIEYDTVVTTVGAGRSKTKQRRFAFLFENKTISVQYVLNVTDKGEKLTAAVYSSDQDLTDSMRFEPFYYWSFTILKNVAYSTLYLGCINGRALLIPMDSTSYPDARALFITNEYELDVNI